MAEYCKCIFCKEPEHEIQCQGCMHNKPHKMLPGSCWRNDSRCGKCEKISEEEYLISKL